MFLLHKLNRLQDLKNPHYMITVSVLVTQRGDPAQHRPWGYQAVLLCFNQRGRLLFSVLSAGGQEAGK